MLGLDAIRHTKLWRGGPRRTRVWAYRASIRLRVQCVLLAGRPDLDSARLRGRGLWNRHREQTVAEIRRDLLAIDEFREPNGALERAGNPLRGINAKLAVLRGIQRRILLTADREHVLLEAQLDVRLTDAGQLGDDDIGIALLDDVERRHPNTVRRVVLPRAIHRLIEYTIERHHPIEGRVERASRKHCCLLQLVG